MTRLLSGELLPTPVESVLADFNDDAALDLADLLLLQRVVLSSASP
jgi:hypothetical protein